MPRMKLLRYAGKPTPSSTHGWPASSPSCTRPPARSRPPDPGCRRTERTGRRGATSPTGDPRWLTSVPTDGRGSICDGWTFGPATGNVGRRSRRLRSARLGRIAMSSSHRRSTSGLGWCSARDLGRRAGAMKLVRTTVEAPANLGIDVIGVPPGSPVRLDLRLESVVEGWVTERRP